MLWGEVWWAELGAARGSEPAYRRPVVIVQADAFNRSALGTVMVVAVTSNLARAEAPGNVRLAKGMAGVPKGCVVQVAHVLTMNREDLTERLGQLPRDEMAEVDRGLRLSLGLG